jgi:hypothetical protein
MGNYSNVMAEVWALKECLVLAKIMGFPSICIEVDAEMIVLMLNNTSRTNLVMEPLSSDCRNLLQAFTSQLVKHLYREINQCADALANLRLHLELSSIVFVNPLPVVENLLPFDKADFYCNNMICV